MMQVEAERSVDLMEQFRECSTEMHVHDGAHMMPTCSGVTKHAISSFLNTFVM